MHAVAMTKNDFDDALSFLNPEQYEAVTTTEGPLLVLAGAGTGKTRVLTTRVSHILNQGLAEPWQILAVTFTNKAAGEMKSRIKSAVPYGVEGMWLGTFHALCTKILRRHIDLLGYETNFSIIDTDDQLRLLKQLITSEGIDISRYTPKLMGILISRWKDKAYGPEQAKQHDAKADSVALFLYQLYQERLKILNVVDFGDLLMLTLQLFQQFPEVLKHYHAQFRYILVDEYQDTNVVQYLWLRLLAQGTPNICCVGDDDQSIYGWRGAEVGNILRFEHDFPGAKIIRLEKNYRSTTHILAAASALIAHNKGRLGKTLHSAAGDEGEKITLKSCWNCTDEARYIGDEIEAHQRKGVSLNHMAILVRAGFQTRQFEERLMTIGIPYRVIGGLRFYERAEIRDALAYFRLVFQPSDGLAFERIVNLPRRGIGQTSLNLFHQTARDEGLPLPKAARLLLETNLLKGQARTSLMLFFQHIDHWHDQIDHTSPSELAGIILDQSGYMTLWRQDTGPDAPGRIENLKELIRAMDEFDSFQGFLEHVSLVLDTTNTNQDDMINVMTLHGAKGLEFDTVFLPGWEDSLFPHPRSMEEEGGLEEERRLAYVGLTRARYKAYITHASFRRMPQGGRPAHPSQFIHELPKEHLIRIHSNGHIDEGGNLKWFSSMPPARPAATQNVYLPNRFKRDERVFHQKFGYGYVQSVEGDKLVIDFETSGIKNIMADFVEKV